MVALLLAQLQPSDRTAIQLPGHIQVEVAWTTGQFPRGPRSVVVGITRGRTRQTQVIDLPAYSWPEKDIAFRPAALLTRGPKPGQAILDLTLSIESGVYGYRRVQSYIVSPGSKPFLTKLGNPIEFSDFGSWRRFSPSEIETWDVIYDDGKSHHSPHRYRMIRIRQSTAKNQIVRTWSTKGEYNASWNTSASPFVAAKNDPLREFGSAWSWWGDRKGCRYEVTP